MVPHNYMDHEPDPDIHVLLNMCKHLIVSYFSIHPMDNPGLYIHLFPMQLQYYSRNLYPIYHDKGRGFCSRMPQSLWQLPGSLSVGAERYVDSQHTLQFSPTLKKLTLDIA